MNIKVTTALTATAVLLSLSASAGPHGRGDVVDLNRPDPARERPVVILNQPSQHKPTPGRPAAVAPGPRPAVVPPQHGPVQQGPRPAVVPPQHGPV
ncbi:MAG: hypothetical protein IJJ33_11975, partial [Victivallales bacterium]|nr:hypothetical protein [Victivallales bacterium]